MIQTAIQLVTLAYVAYLPISLGRHRRAMDALLQQQLGEMKRSVEYAFLTPAEREQLLAAAPALALTQSTGEKGKDPWEIEACFGDKHRWSATWYTEPRRFQYSDWIEDDDGKTFVRQCLDCSYRQARSTKKSKRIDGNMGYDWYAD